MIDRRGLTGSQGEFGRAERVVPLWPGQPPPQRCPRGHELAVGGARAGWLHLYQQPSTTCRVCADLGLPGATWCLVDPTEQDRAASSDEPPHSHDLVLRATPPATRGGLGQIALWIERDRAGVAQLRVCGPCQVGVIEHVHVEPIHRELGYGRLLVAAGLARGPGYTWSVANIGRDADVITRAFAASVLSPLLAGQAGPHRCTDMRRARGETDVGP